MLLSHHDPLRSTAFFVGLTTLLATTAHAQVPNDMTCYSVKDPIVLTGVVDLKTDFGLQPGCIVSKTAMLCVSSRVAVSAIANKKTQTPITPLEFSVLPLPGDQMCYRVKCPPPYPADQSVTDQFGARSLANLKPQMVCTPALPGTWSWASPPTDLDLFRGFPATGQMTAFVTDKNGAPGSFVADDGSIEAGSTLAYVDNGDGTITDLNTGLMWEKKSDDGSLHDKDDEYPWSSTSADTIWDWLDDINAEGGTGFAGYDDWRIPNVKELQSIVDYDLLCLAMDFPVFQNGCATDCTVLTCSCGACTGYWSSTTLAQTAGWAWFVNFYGGQVGSDDKSMSKRTRAVRNAW